MNKIFIFGFLINSLAFAAISVSDNKINSFARALNTGLKNIGVIMPQEELQAYIGSAFSPNSSTSAPCISGSIQLTEDYTLTNLLLGAGLKETRFYVGKKVWSSAIARQFLKSTVRDALIQTNIVLMRGGWRAPAGNLDWGVVESMDGKERFIGRTTWGEAVQEGAPEKFIILTPINESVAPMLLREKILKTAVAKLNKSILLNKSPGGLLICGAELIDNIADRLHRKPYCRVCNSKSYICLYKSLKTFYDDLGAGANYLSELSKHSPDYMKNEIAAAAVQLAEARDLFSPYLNLEKLEKIMRDRRAQAKMAEKIRKIKYKLTEAARALALATNEEVIDADLQQDLNISLSKREEKRLARTLPLFSRINGLNNTFFLSATMAAEMLGVEKPVAWLKGVSGYSLRFLIDTNSFTFITDISDGYDCMERYIRAAGLIPIFNSFDVAMPVAAENLIRKEIIDSIDKSAPVIISAPGTTGKWGVITGYTDYGMKFLCRLPYDTNYFFSEIQEIPDITISLRKNKNAPTTRSQVKSALRQLVLLSINTNFSEFASGAAAINLWIDKCYFYAKNKQMPSLHFAEQNEILWLGLRDKLRNSYNFLDLLAEAAPQAEAPMTAARNLYVKAVELMNFTYADGNVLKEKNGTVFPKDWHINGSVKQMETLEKVKKLIDESNSHIILALKQLKNK